jgi:hypothetical protein
VREILESCAADCNLSDGYTVGQTLHALVWDADGTIVGEPKYVLTAEDLGVSDSEVV